MFLAGGNYRSGRHACRSRIQPALRGARIEGDAGAVRGRRSAERRRRPIREQSFRSTNTQARPSRSQVSKPDDRCHSCCTPDHRRRRCPSGSYARCQRRPLAYRPGSCALHDRHVDAGNDRHRRHAQGILPSRAGRTASPPQHNPERAATARSARTGWISSGSYGQYMHDSRLFQCSEPENDGKVP